MIKSSTINGHWNYSVANTMSRTRVNIILYGAGFFVNGGKIPRLEYFAFYVQFSFQTFIDFLHWSVLEMYGLPPRRTVTHTCCRTDGAGQMAGVGTQRLGFWYFLSISDHSPFVECKNKMSVLLMIYSIDF